MSERFIALNVGTGFLYTASAFVAGVFSEHLPIALSNADIFALFLATFFTHLGSLAIWDGIKNS